MTEIEYCPHCNANLRGEEIPEEQRHYFGKHTHFGRKIGLYDRDLDRTVAWKCPDCGKTWERE